MKEKNNNNNNSRQKMENNEKKDRRKSRRNRMKERKTKNGIIFSRGKHIEERRIEKERKEARKGR